MTLTLRRLATCTAFSAAALMLIPASAQALDLPAKSPKAMAMQQVGVTDMTITWNSPGVKKRKIFGGLVAFDKLWRTGANSATKITFSQDVKVAGKDVPAGKYAVFTIPGKKTWTFILNKNHNQGGTRKYDKKLDQVRVQIKPTKAPKRERMTFLFANTTDDATRLDLEWDTVRLSVPIVAHTKKLVAGHIKKEVKTSSRAMANAARYFADHKDMKQALAFIDMSLAIDQTWFNTWLKADFLAKSGKVKEAIPYGEKAWEMGNKAEYFFWKSTVKKKLAEWKAKK